MSKTGYVNGSDLLLSIGGKAMGHCSSHEATFTSETKERAVKAPVTKGISFALWTNKGVVKLTASFKADGLRFYGETEVGYKTLLDAWQKGETIEVTAFEREEEGTETGLPNPYIKIPCVITSLTETAPANDDATYSVQLESAGAPTLIDASKVTGETLAS